jgi:predicted GNAT family acetyltransferase
MAAGSTKPPGRGEVLADEPLDAFIARHAPALAREEARHNMLAGILATAAVRRPTDLATWTLGAPGACAVQKAGHNLILGELTQAHGAALAQALRERAYSGVVGPDRSAEWFTAAAAEHGHRFAEPMPQRIYALRARPRFPGAPGAARTVTAADAEQFGDWLRAFIAEALPHDAPPSDPEITALAGSGRLFFWEVQGRPVAMAGIVRETARTTAISLVYTPPAERGRGYAGSATAAVAEHAFARGRTTACLYTDLRNPLSNRCYIKIGFEPVCDAAFYARVEGPDK